MNILFVSNSYKEPGTPATGLPNYLKRVTLSLVSLGHQATIIYSAPYSQHRIEDGVEIFAIRIPSHIRGFKERFLAEGYYLNKKVEELTEENTFDIIQFASIGGISMFYRGNIPSVMRLSSYAKTYFSTYSTLTEEQVEIMSELERKASESVDGIFAPCSITAYFFGRDIDRDVDVIESPFVNDVKKFNYSIYRRDLSDKKYVLFFGTLYIEKGIKVIGEIIEKFLTEYPELFFVAVGEERTIDGKTSTQFLVECAGKCANKVKVIPQQPHAILYPIIQNAEFVILPSLMDNLPNACIEAIHFSKIVIGTEGASFEQLIKDGYNGFLCKIGDPVSLLSKMNAVMQLSQKNKKKICERANDTIESLRPEIIVRRLIDYYSSIIVNFKMTNDAKETKCKGSSCFDFSLKDLEFSKESLISEADKMYLQRRLLLFWTKMKISGNSLSKRLKSRGIKSVSVYGVGDIGRLVLDELENSDIHVLCAIDRCKTGTLPVTIVEAGNPMPNCDAVIVTPIDGFVSIAENLEKIYSGQIISIEDLIVTEE